MESLLNLCHDDILSKQYVGLTIRASCFSRLPRWYISQGFNFFPQISDGIANVLKFNIHKSCCIFWFEDSGINYVLLDQRDGNGTPLQWSCLENPRDGGAWWAAVYGVAQSQTRLKWLSRSKSQRVVTGFNVGFCIMPKEWHCSENVLNA